MARGWHIGRTAFRPHKAGGWGEGAEHSRLAPRISRPSIPSLMGKGRAIYVLGALLMPVAVHAEGSPGVGVRVGNHTGFGRIVFDVVPGTTYKLSRDGDTVAIAFPANTALRKPAYAPSNVRSLKTAADRAEIVVAAGAAVREMRIDGRVVIDVLDPSASVPPPAKPAKRPVEPPMPKAVPDPVKAPTAPEPPAPKPVEEHAAAAVAPAPIPTPAPPSAAILGPVALAAAPIVPPEGVAFTVPLGSKAGAAAFRRGGTVYVVFDERRPIDLAALRGNPVFGTANVRELQAGTLLELHPPPDTVVALSLTQTGWKISVQPSTKPPRAIPYAPKDGHLDLPADAPGSVVSMADPSSGATLLVGTLRRPGQAVATGRRTAEFGLFPAIVGIVLEPLADNVALRTVPTGFLVTGGPNGLAITPPTPTTEAAVAAVHLTRRFKLPAQSPEALTRALSRGIGEAAAALPRARGPKRRAIATTMLSLGMGAEAEALLLVAAEQDPKEAASPDTIGLTAIGALLAGRISDAGGIDDRRLTGTDEIALWRAIRQASVDEGSSAAAAVFAATGPLALQYPSGIRDRILPLVAETMVLGGEAAAAKRLLGYAGRSPGLDFARALMKQADGDAPGALAALDALAASRDQRDRARAATRAVELRLASGQIDTAQAADALDKLQFAWRGDRREVALRERIADLRQRAGAWRPALAELRALQAEFPDRAQAVQTHLVGMFMTLLYSEATDALPPLDLVALVDENADLVKLLPANEELQARLADRLMALDLPSRAAPLLEKLASGATTPLGRATFGARLAEMRTAEGDFAGALAALAASAAPALDADMVEKRGILTAVAKGRLGDPTGAIEALSGLTGLRVDTARASVYEQAGDWAAAEEALMSAVGFAIPATGELTDIQRQLVLRLATAAERSGDRNGLAALRATLDSRLGTGPIADTIRLLTAAPMNGAGDLPRLEREMGLAKAIPGALASFKGQ